MKLNWQTVKAKIKLLIYHKIKLLIYHKIDLLIYLFILID